MHKCQKCETEFGGRFCPECGREWVEEKICPVCGAKAKGFARFCEECGHSFFQESNSNARVCEDNVSSSAYGGLSSSLTVKQSEESKEQVVCTQEVKVEDRPSVLYSLVKNTPIFLLAVFSVLMLAFFAVSVATMPSTTVMGIPVAAQSYGSIYSGVLENIPEIKSVVISIILFTAFICLYALVCIVTSVFHKSKNKRVLYLGEYDILLSEMFTILSPILYTVFIILGGVLMGKLLSLDGGSGLIKIGAYSKLVFVFSIVFFVLSFILSILRTTKYETFSAQGGSMSAERKAELAGFYATHEPPIEPSNVGKPTEPNWTCLSPAEELGYYKEALAYLKYKDEVRAYKFDKHRYDNGKEGRTSSGVLWLNRNKVAVTMAIIIIAITVILLATLIPYTTNIFRANKVDDIRLGMSQEQVLKILGDPYDEKDISDSLSNGILSGGNGLIDSVVNSGKDESDMVVVRWRYYDKKYAKERKKSRCSWKLLDSRAGLMRQ